VLHAVGSSDTGRAEAFASTYGASVAGTYADVLARDDVDAVYIGTVHTGHAQLAIAAMDAGKAVLCEKPVTPTPEATASVLDAAARSGRPFLEAYKYRFGPMADALRQLVESGELGRLERLEASFGFESDPQSGRLFDPALAGGAILDVGGYPASLAVGIAAWAGLPEPALVRVDGTVGETGVDVDASVDLAFGDFVASLGTSILRNLPEEIRLVGSEGTVEVPDLWGDRLHSPTTAVLSRAGAAPREIVVSSIDPFAAEADAVSLALARGVQEIPEMPWAQTATVARVLEEWRRALD